MAAHLQSPLRTHRAERPTTRQPRPQPHKEIHLVPDRFWVSFQRVVPAAPPRPQGGRRRYGDREALAAILFVATSGCTWWQTPEVFGPSWTTVYRRFASWSERGPGLGRAPPSDAYDYDHLRRRLRSRGIVPCIARRGIESSARLGRHLRTIERTVSWLGAFRRLHRRYEHKSEHLLASPASPQPSSATADSPGDDRDQRRSAGCQPVDEAGLRRLARRVRGMPARPPCRGDGRSGRC
ncbi:transposase [Streptomyces sp. JW3]|uniref:transposase n=1 Tax=Streptomyces sp. JW3 TaxID=3456955 RepID=UPI003FA45010